MFWVVRIVGWLYFFLYLIKLFDFRLQIFIKIMAADADSDAVAKKASDFNEIITLSARTLNDGQLAVFATDC